MARKERGALIVPGVWKEQNRYTVKVTVGSGKNRLDRETSYPLDTKLRVMTDWQEETRVALRKLVPAHAKGTLAADIAVYLKAVKTMASFKDRERDLALWAHEFPNRARHTIKTHEISAVLQKWFSANPTADREEPFAAMTVFNRRTALMDLWTELDGKRAPNPVDASFEPDKPTLTAKDIPWATIEKVFTAIPDRGQGVRGQKRSEVNKTKIRLWLMAHTGLPHKLMKQIEPEHIDHENQRVRAAKRRKGKGVDSRMLPLTPEAYAALEAFELHGCFGGFSNSSMRKVWQGAWLRVHPSWPATKKIPYPYQLRHSFATRTVVTSKDEKGTSLLLMHSPTSNMMPRYTIGANETRMQNVINSVSGPRLVKGAQKQEAS